MRRFFFVLLVLASACDNDTRTPGGDVTDVPMCDPAACTTPRHFSTSLARKVRARRGLVSDSGSMPMPSNCSQ